MKSPLIRVDSEYAFTPPASPVPRKTPVPRKRVLDDGTTYAAQGVIRAGLFSSDSEGGSPLRKRKVVPMDDSGLSGVASGLDDDAIDSDDETTLLLPPPSGSTPSASKPPAATSTLTPPSPPSEAPAKNSAVSEIKQQSTIGAVGSLTFNTTLYASYVFLFILIVMAIGSPLILGPFAIAILVVLGLLPMEVNQGALPFIGDGRGRSAAGTDPTTPPSTTPTPEPTPPGPGTDVTGSKITGSDDKGFSDVELNSDSEKKKSDEGMFQRGVNTLRDLGARAVGRVASLMPSQSLEDKYRSELSRLDEMIRECGELYRQFQDELREARISPSEEDLKQNIEKCRQTLVRLQHKIGRGEELAKNLCQQIEADLKKLSPETEEEQTLFAFYQEVFHRQAQLRLFRENLDRMQPEFQRLLDERGASSGVYTSGSATSGEKTSSDAGLIRRNLHPTDRSGEFSESRSSARPSTPIALAPASPSSNVDEESPESERPVFSPVQRIQNVWEGIKGAGQRVQEGFRALMERFKGAEKRQDLSDDEDRVVVGVFDVELEDLTPPNLHSWEDSGAPATNDADSDGDDENDDEIEVLRAANDEPTSEVTKPTESDDVETASTSIPQHPNNSGRRRGFGTSARGAVQGAQRMAKDARQEAEEGLEKLRRRLDGLRNKGPVYKNIRGPDVYRDNLPIDEHDFANRPAAVARAKAGPKKGANWSSYVSENSTSTSQPSKGSAAEAEPRQKVRVKLRTAGDDLTDKHL